MKHYDYLYVMKRCTMCGIKKPETSEYFQFRKERDCFMTHCLECKRRKAREYIAKYDIKKRREKYANDNKEKTRKYQREYYLKNIDLIKKRAVESRRKRVASDPNLRLNLSVGANMRHSLKGNKNGRHWETLVNFTQEDLRKHLEIQFRNGMTWQNYGEWNIDHKIPISIFNINGAKSKGFKKCWALENLQPLWQKENFRKGNKLFA